MNSNNETKLGSNQEELAKIGSTKKSQREKLREKLRAKIGEVRIARSSKTNKEKVLERNLAKVGIDKEKLKADLEALKKQGGLSINLPMN